ncbi:MAG: hypothetical protein ACKO6N_26710 [Myxococcota bacterium]
MTEFKLKKGPKVYHIQAFSSLLELARRGLVQADDPVFVPSVERWVRADAIRELRPLLASATPTSNSTEDAAEEWLDLGTEFIEPLSTSGLEGGATIEVDVEGLGLDISVLAPRGEALYAPSPTSSSSLPPEPLENVTRDKTFWDAPPVSIPAEPVNMETRQAPVWSEEAHGPTPWAPFNPRPRSSSPQVPVWGEPAPKLPEPALPDRKSHVWAENTHPPAPSLTPTPDEWLSEVPTDPRLRLKPQGPAVDADALASMFDRPNPRPGTRTTGAPGSPTGSLTSAAPLFGELRPEPREVTRETILPEPRAGTRTDTRTDTRTEGRTDTRTDSRTTGSGSTGSASPPASGGLGTETEVRKPTRSAPPRPEPLAPPDFEQWIDARAEGSASPEMRSRLESAGVVSRRADTKQQEGGTRWGRLVGLILLTLLALAVGRGVMRSISMPGVPTLAEELEPPRGPLDPVPADQGVRDTPHPQTFTEEADQATDGRLRAQLRPDITPMRTFDQAQDELFGELLNLRLSVLDVKLEPLKGERFRSVRTTESDVVVRIKPGRLADEEQVALCGLVMGKYLQQQRLNLRFLMVQIERGGDTPLVRQVPSKDVLQYFERQLSYRQFLLAAQAGTLLPSRNEGLAPGTLSQGTPEPDTPSPRP